MVKNFFILLVVLITSTGFAVADDMQQVRDTLKKLMPKATPDSIKPTPIAGLYEAIYGNQVIYMTKDGHYMIEGDLYDIQNRVNLTENVRQVSRKKTLDTLDPAQMIVFSPADKPVKHVITAFTDIDCGYCRKLHSQIKEYNDLGIEVRYVAFPRSGKNTESYFKAVAVWCAKDRNKALTFAKGGAKLQQLKDLAQVEDSKSCTEAVGKELTAAHDIGLSGTPTLFMESGQIIPGYVPPQRLFNILEDSKKS